MASFSPRTAFFFLLCLCMCVSFTQGDELREEMKDYFDELKTSYDKLPDVGKFATGLSVAFVATRTVVRSAVGAVKVAGATYVAAEALNMSGAFNQLSEDSKDRIDMVKKGTLKIVDKYRTELRRRLKPEGIRSAIKAAATKEKAAAAGAAAGVFFGLTM